MKNVIEIESYENIPEYVGIKNTGSITVKDGYEWYGHSYGICVGIIYDDGTVDSYIKKDSENGNTDIFDRLRTDIRMIEKRVTVRNYDTLKLKDATNYYIPFKVKGHSSQKETVTDSYVDGCMNVQYSVEYEILLVADYDLKRYITVEFETEGCFSSSFFDQIEDIEDMFEEWFEEGSCGFIVKDGYKTVSFYDEVGIRYDVDISSVRELLSMITSIRVIKCERKII